MNTSRVVTHGSLTLDLATIKCFKLIAHFDGASSIIVEHKQRFGYIQHPKTGEFEKQEYQDITSMDYSDYETASAYRDEWEDIWQSYLKDQD